MSRMVEAHSGERNAVRERAELVAERGHRMSVVETDPTMSSAGLRRTPRTLPDPLLLFAVPVAFALLLAFVRYGNSWPVGIHFRGTLWEPARALLDGISIYPEPAREAVLVGNPAVYPPVFILASVPLALLPATAAAWVWRCVLAGVLLGPMWILGVRDWRCLVLAVTSPVVVHGVERRSTEVRVSWPAM